MNKALVLGVLGVFACGGSKTHLKAAAREIGDSSQAGASLKVPQIDKSRCDPDGKQVLQYDLNRDDKPDVWKLYKSQDQKGTKVDILTCKQADLDHDSKVDYVVQYDDDGAIVWEEYDFDFDGKFDARWHYDKKTGKRYLVERTTAFRGNPDTWEKFDANGRTDTIVRDRNGDGKPDYWEQFVDGKLEAMLYDDDFDGKVDRREETKTATAPTPDEAPAPEVKGEPDSPTAPGAEPAAPAPAPAGTKKPG